MGFSNCAEVGTLKTRRGRFLLTGALIAGAMFVLTLLLSGPVQAWQNTGWDLDKPDNYKVSDAGKVAVEGGTARLREREFPTWLTFLDIAGWSDRFQGACFDSGDNFLTIRNGYNKQSYVVKYDTSGEFVWEKTSFQFYEENHLHDIVVDSKDNVMAVGWFRPDMVLSYEQRLLLFNKDGNVLSESTGVDPESDNAWSRYRDVDMDSKDNAYLMGVASDMMPMNDDLYVQKRENSTGAIENFLLWEHRGRGAICVCPNDDLIIAASDSFLVTCRQPKP